MDQFWSWWAHEVVAGNTVGGFTLFAVGLFLTFSIAKTAQVLFHGRLRRLVEASDTQIDDALLSALERPLYLLINALGLRATVEVLVLPEFVDRVVTNVVTVIITVFIAWGINRTLDAIRKVFIDPLVEASETKLDDQLVPIADRTLKALIWSMAILIAFSNLGYDILSLLTGLGIGGLAVAMAAQATLSNVLGSVTIFADQPFQVDDLISIGDHTGVVTRVGLRACRMRTFEGYIVTIPNASVVDQPVVNRTVGEQWRYDATVGLVYDTTAAEMGRAMQVLRDILQEHPRVEDYAVRFTDFGDSALEITFAFFVTAATPVVYLDTVSEVNLTLLQRFDGEGFSMAFPSVSVYMEK